MKGLRYARTLDEAFGLSAESACAISCYRAPRHHRIILWTVLIVGLLSVVWSVCA
ncbi:MAG: hypothetical protein KGL51_11805 [Betaproteobacteria bacterium]|nr:hypothetical protein [Betaproteobacteria bacterium]